MPQATTVRDAYALIRAIQHDDPAGRAILNGCNTRAVAEYLARVMATQFICQAAEDKIPLDTLMAADEQASLRLARSGCYMTRKP